jgi:hypothetical protein
MLGFFPQSIFTCLLDELIIEFPVNFLVSVDKPNELFLLEAVIHMVDVISDLSVQEGKLCIRTKGTFFALINELQCIGIDFVRDEAFHPYDILKKLKYKPHDISQYTIEMVLDADLRSRVERDVPVRE